MAELGSTNYTIQGRAAAVIKDVQRDWMWQLTIPGISNMAGMAGIEGLEDEITIRARTCSLPARGVEVIESNWMSQKQFFPGKPTFGNTVSVSFEESENLNVSRFLFNWQQHIMDITSGHSNALAKRPGGATSYVTDMYLNLVSYSGQLSKDNPDASRKYFLFKNVFPTNVGDVSLDYSANGQIKYDVTFQFDWWYLVDADSEILSQLST